MREEVIVCGGGPSGTAAALQAARTGAKTLLIERFGFLGGNATAALVNPWMGHRWRDPETGREASLIGGVFRGIVAALRAEGAYGTAISPACFDEERLKIVYDRLLTEAGVAVCLHTRLVGARREGDRIAAVDVVSKDGARTIEGDVFVDATGDGDLAALAGCDLTVGRAADGLTQAMTTSFRMAGVDKDALMADGSLSAARALVNPLYQEAREAGRLDHPHRDFMHFYDYPRPGVLHFNMTRINRANGLSSQDLTHAEIEGRRQAALLADWLVKESPYFRHAWLEKLACHVGVRETRHVKGLYTFSKDDVAEGRKFEDAVARSRYFIDIHSPTGPGFGHETPGTKGAPRASYAPPPNDWYEVPYRSIVASDAANLLVPCRALSATHEGAAAVRVMATMTALGQAAGLAAACAQRRRVPAAEVDGSALRGRLEYLDAPPEIGAPW